MDAERFKQAYARLEALDERLTHKVRPTKGRSLTRPTAEQLEVRMQDLADYSVALKEVVAELFLAIAGRPTPL
jgi:hypothetical protein